MLKEPLDSQVKYIGIYVDFILERFLGFGGNCLTEELRALSGP